MSNTQAVCNSFKFEVMRGLHALGTSVVRAGTGADALKAALYLSSATVNASTTAYSATGEVTGSGYTAGGIGVTNATAPALSGSTAVWTPSASLVFGPMTVGPTDAVLIYNDTAAGDPAIEVCTFTAQTLVAGTLTLTMPVNAAGTALLNLA